MRKRIVCAGLALMGALALPAPARASIGWWDYLEEMSGPGPFSKRGPLGIFTIDTGVACRIDTPASSDQAGRGSRWVFINSADCALDPTRRGPRKVTDFFSVRLGATSTEGDRPLFSDRSRELQGKVTAWTVEAKFTRRLDAAIELAAGGGIIFFTGDTIDHQIARPTVTPLSIVFTPIGLLHRHSPEKFDGLVGLRFEQIAVLGGLTAKDFNRTSTSSFQSDNIDLIRRFSITLDVSPFVFPRSR
ncbi:MAG: hypothetical protein ABJA98_28390 [Acidobacteriota bacterium]